VSAFTWNFEPNTQRPLGLYTARLLLPRLRVYSLAAAAGFVMNATFNGHSMVAKLRRVLVCSPQAAGWDTPGQSSHWRELGFRHAPDFSTAQAQHQELCRQLKLAGAEVVELPASPESSLDAVYAHDPSFTTDRGMVILHPGKPSRIAEAKLHKKFCQDVGVPVLGEVKPPAVAEAGDMVWLASRTLLVGCGYRTNAGGIFQLHALLEGVEVITAPLPYGPGPSACLHLMSLMSMLDEQTVLLDLPWLTVNTVELFKARHYRFVEIDPAERDTLACNVLALGDKRLLALEENPKTNEKLRAVGFEVLTFPGSELCINGGGGPTCLTRPLLRG
jgi:N-dimethylarginine dimethylaminohydrolase